VDALPLLLAGAELLKFGRNGQAHPKRIRLDEDLTCLYWNSRFKFARDARGESRASERCARGAASAR
jgi:hypothetical protein